MLKYFIILAFINTTSNYYKIPSSSHPVIDLADGKFQTITLSANTFPVIIDRPVNEFTLEICQPTEGGRWIWVWPKNISGEPVIILKPGTCYTRTFKHDCLKGIYKNE